VPQADQIKRILDRLEIPIWREVRADLQLTIG
jgi:hypothetical protein